MADVHDKKTRSYNMSKIKGKNTKPEMLVRKFLHAQGYRYRLHDKKIPGTPDIVLKKYNSIIDIRGCFWHNHSACKFGEKIVTPSETVTAKRESASVRDSINDKKWEDLGWQVIVIWADCELEPKRKTSKKREETLNKILKQLKIADSNN